MKILFLCSQFKYTNLYLQPWRHVYELATRLASRGNEVAILTDSSVSTNPELRSIRFFFSQKISSITPFALKGLEDAVEKFNPDILYMFGDALSGIFVSFIKRLNLRFALHIDSNVYPLSHFVNLTLREILISYKLVLTSAMAQRNVLRRTLSQESIKLITVPSKTLMDHLLLLGVENRILVTPLSLDEEFLNCSWRYNWNNFTILYLGSPSTLRGTDTLVKATAILAQRFDDFRVILLLRRISNEAKYDICRLHNLALKLDICDKISFINSLQSRASVSNYLLSSHVVTLPFKVLFSEPPLSVLEAFATGRPVITSSVSSLTELVAEGRGLIIPPNDPTSLARALSTLLMDRSMAERLGKNARSFANKISSWDYLASWTQERLQAIINGY